MLDVLMLDVLMLDVLMLDVLMARIRVNPHNLSHPCSITNGTLMTRMQLPPDRSAGITTDKEWVLDV